MGQMMNQQPAIEPAISATISSVDTAMHDGVAQMNHAAKDILNTVFDLSVEAMQQCHRLAEQNVGFCTDMQDAWLKQTRQMHEANLKLWAAMPIGDWLGGVQKVSAETARN